MASIIYEGMAGSGGNLFEGKKIWFALRVPSRDRWITGVKSNGGIVVMDEKAADLMIADHVRKDAPSGSYSWKYIEAALRDGKLPELEDHVIVHKASIKQAGKSGPTKQTRTPFTKADDIFLWRWVLNGERKGIPAKGLELYKDLEKVNKRHTVQSWRDRWVKYLSLGPRPDINLEDELLVSDAAVPSPAPPQSETPIVHLRQATHTLKKGVRSRASRPKGIPQAPTPILHAKNPPFPNPATADDLKHLLDEYDAIENIDPAKEDAAWDAWVQVYPQYSAQEWKQIWINDVRPLRQNSEIDEDRDQTVLRAMTSSFFSSSQPAGSRPETSRQSSLPPKSSMQQVASRSDLEESQQPSSPPKSTAQQVTSKSDPEGSRRSLPPRNTAQKSIPRHDIEEIQQTVTSPSSDGQLFLPQISNRSQTPSSSSPLESIKDPWSSPIPSTITKALSSKDRSKFNRSILLFAQERDYNLDLCPEIEGKDVGLYELYIYVAERGGSIVVERDHLWPQIATKFGFKPFVDRNAWKELRVCYENNLMNFEEFRTDYKKKTKTKGQTATKSIMAIDDDDEQDEQDLPSLPRIAKRKLSPTQQQQELRQRNVKRRRVDKGKGVARDEIPSTPEALFKKPGLLQSSPLKQSQTAVLEESDEEDPFAEPLERPLERNIFTKRPNAVAQDPETQEFHYPTLNFDDDDQDITNLTSSPGRSGTNELDILDVGEDPEVKEYREHWIGLGYDEDVVDEAMRITTMDKDLMPQLIELLMANKEDKASQDLIPGDERGVWTAEDDQIFLGGAENMEEGWERIVEKHTLERVEMRARFLRDMGLITLED